MTSYYTGNVQDRFTLPAGQSITLFGDDIILSAEPLSAARARAVHDFEAMSVSDQRRRGRPTPVELTPAEWQQLWRSIGRI